MAFRKSICIVATVLSVCMFAVCSTSQAQRNGFRIGNAIQFGGGQGFRFGRVQFGGGQGVQIGQPRYQQFAQPAVRYYQPNVQQYVQPQIVTGNYYVPAQQGFVQQPYAVQPYSVQPYSVQPYAAQSYPGVVQPYSVAGQVAAQPGSTVQPSAEEAPMVKPPETTPMAKKNSVMEKSPEMMEEKEMAKTEMAKPEMKDGEMAKSDAAPMEKTEVVRPWDPSQGIDNDDEVVRVVEPSNDGMIRFKYPKSAKGKLTYTLEGAEYQLDPGQTLALPANEKFAFSFMPGAEAEAVTPNITEQGTYMFVESDGIWGFEKYTAPGTKVETPATETPNTDGN